MPAIQASAYFKGADALYVPLKNEGYVGKTIPNKLMMSMAFAKPIVAMLEGDGKNILIDSDGAVFSEQSYLSLATAFKTVAGLSQKELKRLGQNNLNYYKNNFTIDIVARQIEAELLNKI